MTESNWLSFLESQGASIDSGKQRINFTQQNHHSSLKLIPLLEQTLLSLSGPDSEKFLQGQVSCDVSQVSTTKSLLGSNCTPKGNVISAFRLIKHADEQLFLRLNTAIFEQAKANLAKYIVFSKADVAGTEDSHVGIGLQGEGAEALIESVFSNAPKNPGEQLVIDKLIIIRTPGTTERYELWLPTDQAEAIWTQLCATATPTSNSEWQLAEIQAGLVQLDQESVDNYLPQMLNLQAVDGVSFDKGCYTGQEIITRLQYRGKLKKVLYRASVGEGTEPTPGMSLHTPSRKSVGKILACAPLPEGGFEVQAVIGKKAADEDDLRLATQDGPKLELLELPYQLDAELFER